METWIIFLYCFARYLVFALITGDYATAIAYMTGN